MRQLSAVALQAAKDCVIATQAPDTASMGAAQAKIVECSTGDFGAQAVFYGSMLTEAYQAAAVQVEVADLRAAVERHHDDGSVDVLVAVRTKVTNSEAAEQERVAVFQPLQCLGNRCDGLVNHSLSSQRRRL